MAVCAASKKKYTNSPWSRKIEFTKSNRVFLRWTGMTEICRRGSYVCVPTTGISERKMKCSLAPRCGALQAQLQLFHGCVHHRPKWLTWISMCAVPTGLAQINYSRKTCTCSEIPKGTRRYHMWRLGGAVVLNVKECGCMSLCVHLSLNATTEKSIGVRFVYRTRTKRTKRACLCLESPKGFRRQTMCLVAVVCCFSNWCDTIR